MNQLVIQHPQLDQPLLARLGTHIGATPSAVVGQCARWTLSSGSAQIASGIAEQFQVDAAWLAPPEPLSRYKLITFDMDSTLITIECIDEMADYFGRKAEVAAITEAAMRGEINDYNESLRRRTGLLVGLPESSLQALYQERLRLTPGAEQLIAAAKEAGLKVLLVSGGFTYFANPLGERLGLDFVRANVLEMKDGRMTGALVGEIVNADVKKRVVEETCAAIGCRPDQAIVVGDGANDLKMMSIAGTSIAYRAKPVVRQQARFAINYCGLDAAVNLFSGSAG